MVQSRQFRHTHIDSHYRSALFRYEREFAVHYHQFTIFICQDNKHTIKLGEPDYPVAAVDCGKSLLLGLNEKFVLGNHDFASFSITPSVNFEVGIPETIEGTFCYGKAHVSIKDSTFQYSSPLRHATELRKILQLNNVQPILLTYTGGSPDQRPYFLSVQPALLSLFLDLDLITFCAVHTIFL